MGKEIEETDTQTTRPNEDFTSTPLVFFAPFFTTNLTFFGEMTFVVLMAGACGDEFSAAALALTGASSVLGRLLDFWVCGDAHEAARLVGRGTLWAEEALAAVSGAEYESFGDEDKFGGEVAGCFAVGEVGAANPVRSMMKRARQKRWLTCF